VGAHHNEYTHFPTKERTYMKTKHKKYTSAVDAIGDTGLKYLSESLFSQ
jgi:hypothetical protein